MAEHRGVVEAVADQPTIADAKFRSVTRLDCGPGIAPKVATTTAVTDCSEIVRVVAGVQRIATPAADATMELVGVVLPALVVVAMAEEMQNVEQAQIVDAGEQACEVGWEIAADFLAAAVAGLAETTILVVVAI